MQLTRYSRYNIYIYIYISLYHDKDPSPVIGRLYVPYTLTLLRGTGAVLAGAAWFLGAVRRGGSGSGWWGLRVGGAS